MANDVRTGMPKTPGFPTTNVPTQQTPIRPELEKVVQQQQRPVNKLSPQDAARLAQQAGFQRARKRPGWETDASDLSRTPIPVPEDETDPDAWDGQRLDDAQQHMALAGTQLAEIAQDESLEPLAERLAALSFMPTEEGLRQLEALASKSEPETTPQMAEVAGNIKSLFNLELSDESPVGHALLVAGLVVAGETGYVELTQGAVDEKKLAGGLKTIVERSNHAVGEAQKMNKGVSRELNLQRTFVFKR